MEISTNGRAVCAYSACSQCVGRGIRSGLLTHQAVSRFLFASDALLVTDGETRGKGGHIFIFSLLTLLALPSVALAIRLSLTGLHNFCVYSCVCERETEREQMYLSGLLMASCYCIYNETWCTVCECGSAVVLSIDSVYVWVGVCVYVTQFHACSLHR